MNLAELRELLTHWLSEIKTWRPETKQSWDDYILDDKGWYEYLYPEHGLDRLDTQLCPVGGTVPDRDDVLHVVLFTNDNRYHITGRLPKDGDEGYLGCIVSTRKPRAGEVWTRGNDLPDGPLTKETWDAIVRKIVGYELVAKVKPRLPK